MSGESSRKGQRRRRRRRRRRSTTTNKRRRPTTAKTKINAHLLAPQLGRVGLHRRQPGLHGLELLLVKNFVRLGRERGETRGKVEGPPPAGQNANDERREKILPPRRPRCRRRRRLRWLPQHRVRPGPGRPWEPSKRGGRERGGRQRKQKEKMNLSQRRELFQSFLLCSLVEL